MTIPKYIHGKTDRSLWVCEKIATITGLADESVCPTLAHKALRLGGEGVIACQPIFSQTLWSRLGLRRVIELNGI